MDFLNKITRQLAEMEEQARLLQAMEASGVTRGADGKVKFQPRDKVSPQSRQPQHSKFGGEKKGQKALRQDSKQPQRAKQQQRGQQPQRSLVSQDEVFETPHCATEGGLPVTAIGSSSSPHGRLLDTLYNRSEEAFMLSEILGPPRCVKGWDD